QIADRLALIIAEREFLQMGKEIVTQLVFDIAPDVEDQKPRERSHNTLHTRHADNRKYVEQYVTKWMLLLNCFDSPFEKQRNRHRQSCGSNQAENAARITSAVASDVTPQAVHVV